MLPHGRVVAASVEATAIGPGEEQSWLHSARDQREHVATLQASVPRFPGDTAVPGCEHPRTPTDVEDVRTCVIERDRAHELVRQILSDPAPGPPPVNGFVKPVEGPGIESLRLLGVDGESRDSQRPR